MARYRGRHRAPARFDGAGRAIARTALAGAVAGVPLVVAAPAASAAPDSAWDRLAQCESGGRWDINTGNGYHGGLQFSPTTWRGFGGGEFAPVAYQASRAEQIVVAERVLAVQGWNAWPSCSRQTGVRGEAPSQRSAPAAEPERVRLSAPTTDGGYVVQRGDTLSRIASAQGVAGGWQAIVEKNPGLAANPNMIREGQRLSL
ncbi:hypothetical protein GCM10017691_56240 [Pseudonocardia petroleophila]|uniref:LysM peptidoglycan-binding domain-containing protein n=1 Tax=Pseudonocardia petroleophila TaxID=37331 RepID=A0A7G7MNF3_9PSEU|nr:transglycosylase family protein [Pseudonocardia petroleophila]QNG54314.1 LysM peptidoglycan-binding domain-containing protein [Pseudonocardia petroleophila]